MIAIRRERHAAVGKTHLGERLVYAIGDIHGCYDLLQTLLAAIAGDAEARCPGVPPLLILCGDYVDCGPDTAKVLAALVWLARSSAIEVRILEGNHEAMLGMFLDSPGERSEWLTFGGRRTLESYGVSVPAEGLEFSATATALRDALLDVMPASHTRLLSALEPHVAIGDYLFVHAGVRPGVPLSAQSRKDLLWIREAFLEHPRPSDSIVVHGHSWSGDRPVILPHRIAVDTGAYQTGVLTAVRFDDDGLEVIQAGHGI